MSCMYYMLPNSFVMHVLLSLITLFVRNYGFLLIEIKLKHLVAVLSYTMTCIK